jgi:hypothetical protein
MKGKIWIWIPPITPYILERGNKWITNPIHLQLLNILIYQLQGNNSIPLKSSSFLFNSLNYLKSSYLRSNQVHIIHYLFIILPLNHNVNIYNSCPLDIHVNVMHPWSSCSNLFKVDETPNPPYAPHEFNMTLPWH